MDQKAIGKFIAAMRKQRGLTQEQLGQALGVTNKTISRWETGNYMPDIGMLTPLSSALGVSVNELLAGQQLEDGAEFARKADENLLTVLEQASAFALEERIAYFRKKWLREHKGLIGFWVVLWLLGCFAGIYLHEPLVAAALPIAALALYGYLRNQMMIYVEQRAFRSEKELSQKD